MNNFLSKATIFSLLFACPVVLTYVTNTKYLSAYIISSSYSLNEKIKWLPKKTEMDILTIGSSMALNNISSDEITSGFKTTKYINTGSWGLTIEDIENMLPSYIEQYNPKIVIYPSYIFDFKASTIKYNIKKITAEINNKTPVRIYEFFENPRYIQRTIKNRKNYTSNSHYASMKFDPFGGVPFSNKDFNINKYRWNLELKFKKINNKSYKKLFNIANYLNKKNIQLVFINTPFRQDHHNRIYLSNMKKHTDKIKLSLKLHNSFFIDLSSTMLPENYFVESSHMNKKGADEITRTIIDQYNTHTSVITNTKTYK